MTHRTSYSSLAMIASLNETKTKIFKPTSKGETISFTCVHKLAKLQIKLKCIQNAKQQKQQTNGKYFCIKQMTSYSAKSSGTKGKYKNKLFLILRVLF